MNTCQDLADDELQKKMKAAIDKQYNKNSSKGNGRKKKPNKGNVLIDKVLQQKKHKKIATLGVYKELEQEHKDIINDKNGSKLLTCKHEAQISQIILDCVGKPYHFVFLTDDGLEFLQNLIENQSGKTNHKLWRTIFNTQERQLFG